MEYVPPIAAFLFFLGLMAVQARRGGSSPAVHPTATREQRRRARTFQAAMLVGCVLLFVGLIGGGGYLALLIPAGAVFLACGLAFHLNVAGSREALTWLDAQSASARVLGARTVTPLWGMLAMIVGTGMLAAGIVATVT